MTERGTKRSLRFVAKTLWGLERVYSKHVLMKAGAAGAALALAVGVLAAEAPSGHNVHLVREVNGRRFWRGGAPTKETVRDLVDAGKSRGVQVTFVEPSGNDEPLGGKHDEFLIPEGSETV